MRILIIFGTTEGHTRTLSQRMAGWLRETGASVVVEEATQETIRAARVGGYDAVILAASLHVGRFQPAVADFAREHATALAARPSAFVSVSLSAAGEDPHDWAGLAECVDRFEQETHWRPRALHHAAGAIRYSQYDFFRRLALKHIAHRRGRETVTSQDYDLTDYAALKAFVLQFAAEAQPGALAGAEPATGR